MMKLNGGLFKPSPIKLLAAAAATATVVAAAARFLFPLELYLPLFIKAPLPTAAGPALFL